MAVKPSYLKPRSFQYTIFSSRYYTQFEYLVKCFKFCFRDHPIGESTANNRKRPLHCTRWIALIWKFQVENRQCRKECETHFESDILQRTFWSALDNEMNFNAAEKSPHYTLEIHCGMEWVPQFWVNFHKKGLSWWFIQRPRGFIGFSPLSTDSLTPTETSLNCFHFGCLTVWLDLPHEIFRITHSDLCHCSVRQSKSIFCVLPSMSLTE